MKLLQLQIVLGGNNIPLVIGVDEEPSKLLKKLSIQFCVNLFQVCSNLNVSFPVLSLKHSRALSLFPPF